MIERAATSTRANVPASAFATKATSVRSGGVCAADTLSVRYDAIAAREAAGVRFNIVSNGWERTLRRIAATFGLGIALIACAIATDAASPASKLVVLDVELTGDLGGPELAAQHQARLKLASTRLRESLSRTGLYRIVDSGPAQETVDELKSRYLYLHDCNGCDLDLGRQLGADQVLVAWVDRVSGLILSLTYEIHDVATGQIVARKSFSFRGDNDTSWTHAIDYMVRDLNESATARQ